jgi:hypothetical protein
VEHFTLLQPVQVSFFCVDVRGFWRLFVVWELVEDLFAVRHHLPDVETQLLQRVADINQLTGVEHFTAHSSFFLLCPCTGILVPFFVVWELVEDLFAVRHHLPEVETQLLQYVADFNKLTGMEHFTACSSFFLLC